MYFQTQIIFIIIKLERIIPECTKYVLVPTIPQFQLLKLLNLHVSAENNKTEDLQWEHYSAMERERGKNQELARKVG